MGKCARSAGRSRCGNDGRRVTVTSFRNINVTPDEPVTEWGFEGLLTAIERGSMKLWRRIAAEVRRNPFGKVARLLEDEVIGAVSHEGERELFRQMLQRARHRWEQDAKAEVANRLRSLQARSGLNQRDFAVQLGTSASRLSTYLSGKVTPGADLLVRAERVGESRCAATP
jgi:DNA-binding transcriptional regulator YiaG